MGLGTPSISSGGKGRYDARKCRDHRQIGKNPNNFNETVG